MVDDMFDTKAPNEGGFLLAAHNGDRNCPRGMRQLDTGRTGAARGPRDQHGLSRLHVGAIVKRKPCRAVVHRHRGGLRRTQRLSRIREHAARCGDIDLAEAAAQNGDRSAEFDVVDTFPPRRDHSCSLSTRREREPRGNLIFTATAQHIGKGDPNGLCRDLHLPRSRLRGLNFLELQDVERVTKFV